MLDSNRLTMLTSLVLSNITLLMINDTSIFDYDCDDIHKSGHTLSGIYGLVQNLSYVNHAFLIVCQMETYKGGAGWTVIQRKTDNSINFNRSWIEYSVGFGNLENSFWLGNELLYQKTYRNKYEVYIELIDTRNRTKYARFENFKVSDVSKKYKLTVEHQTGTLGIALKEHDGMMFSTYDQDNDLSTLENCAVTNECGWWFNNCVAANLNGLLSKNASSYPIHRSARWNSLIKDNNIKISYVAMMIRKIS